MKTRSPLRILFFIAALCILTEQVRSVGVCNYMIPSGSVSPSSPSNGASFAVFDSFSPSATYRLNWHVTSISPASENKCDAPVDWNQLGSTSEPTGCSMNVNSTDNIQNSAAGSSGSFSRNRSWSCTAGFPGTWTITYTPEQGGNSYQSSARNYIVH
jgi:hypothetical protein